MGVSLDELNNLYIISDSNKNHKTLEYYIQRKDKIKVSLKVEILFELAKTLNYLHCLQPSIIHRSLRPSSVFISSDFSLKLSDFE